MSPEGKRTLVLLVAAAVLLPGGLRGQVYQKEVYSIPVTAPHGPVEHPFTGGMYNPMHQFADIDSDGDPDLLLFEPSDGRFSFFRNEGSPSGAIFRYERDPFPLPGLFGWFRLADINGDDRYDLMTAPPSGNSLAVYLNTGTPEGPAFTLLSSALPDSAGQVVYSESFSVPSFVDMDGDGDRDFLSLNTSTGTINYYENIGTAASMLLAFRTNRFQDVQICIGCRRGGTGEHGNGSVHFGDIDGDDDPDMLYGDLFHTGLYFYINSGTPAAVSLDSVTAWFPQDDPVLTQGFNQATLSDIDGDGDQDLFVSVMNGLARVDNFRFYRNTGTPQAFQFLEVSSNYLETLDVGLQSAPAFADIDADGDLDLFSGSLDGKLVFFRNTGSASVPAFELEDSALVSSTTSFVHSPAFADIDNDGDKDLFLGHFAGKIEFYRNTGTPSDHVFEREPWLFDTVTVGTYASPSFMDHDGDGDLDLFVGRSLGRVTLYGNTGTPESPAFTLAEPVFQGITVVGNARPAFADEDGDGDADLLVGDSNGELWLFRNEGPPGNPAFVFVTDSFAGIDTLRECAPAAGDLDGDGDIDLIIGCQRGGLEFYRNADPSSVQDGRANGLQRSFLLHQSYPNPFNAAATIRFELAQKDDVLLRIYDLLGREVATLVDGPLPAGIHHRVWNAGGFPSGVYWYRLSVSGSRVARPLLLVR